MDHSPPDAPANSSPLRRRALLLYPMLCPLCCRLHVLCVHLAMGSDFDLFKRRGCNLPIPQINTPSMLSSSYSHFFLQSV